MSAPASKKTQTQDETHIGEYAATQPLSGVITVTASSAVNGLGHGAFVRVEKAGKSSKTS